LKVLKECGKKSEALSFSSDGKKLAIGGFDFKYYVYDVESDYKLLHTNDKHIAGITALDFSTNGKYIQSNCEQNELLYFDVEKGEQVTDNDAVKDETWFTFTCKDSYPTQGIFPVDEDADFINSVSRDTAGKLLASGDDMGLVSVFRWPALFGAEPRQYKAHSEHVGKVKWATDSKRLFSVGGFDRTVMQWKVE